LFRQPSPDKFVPERAGKVVNWLLLHSNVTKLLGKADKLVKAFELQYKLTKVAGKSGNDAKPLLSKFA
jgi:hypothetical protein